MDDIKSIDNGDVEESRSDEIVCDSMHAIFFHRDVCQYILIPGWITTNLTEKLGGCIAIFLAGVLYEWMRKWRKDLFLKYEKGDDYANSKNCLITYMHAIETCYHMIQVFMAYLLMLIFMTYNIWLCTALITGVGFGYIIFNK